MSFDVNCAQCHHNLMDLIVDLDWTESSRKCWIGLRNGLAWVRIFGLDFGLFLPCVVWEIYNARFLSMRKRATNKAGVPCSRHTWSRMIHLNGYVQSAPFRICLCPIAAPSRQPPFRPFHSLFLLQCRYSFHLLSCPIKRWERRCDGRKLLSWWNWRGLGGRADGRRDGKWERLNRLTLRERGRSSLHATDYMDFARKTLCQIRWKHSLLWVCSLPSLSSQRD